MTDRELLEKAARAAGMDWCAYYPAKVDDCSLCLQPAGRLWNPLADDGDALRLAVNLGLSVEPYPYYEQTKHSVIVKQRRGSDRMRESNPTECVELFRDSDEYTATRRAIVRAAAALA